MELRADQPAVWVIGAGVLAALGSLLPWATISAGIFSRTVNGTASNDGVATLVAGLIVVLIGFSLRQKPRGRGSLIGAGLIGIAIGAVAIADYFNLKDATNTISVTIGVGLYMVVLGACLACAGSIIGFAAAKNARFVEPPIPPPGA